MDSLEVQQPHSGVDDDKAGAFIERHLLLWKVAQPAQQCLKNFVESFPGERTEQVQRPYSRKSRHALHKESPGLQKGCPNGNLKWRAAQRRRVRHDRDEGLVESPNATLTTSAGRVLPAWPKSISQTSPRRGVGIFLVERFPKGCRRRTDLFISERTGVERQRTTQHLVSKGAPFSAGKCSKASSKASVSRLIVPIQQNQPAREHTPWFNRSVTAIITCNPKHRCNVA